MTITTRYPIASVTKLFTSTVTMLLCERGRLALTDKIVDLLPGRVTDRLHALDGVDRTASVTVEHLLSHTSGLPDYYDEAPAAAEAPRRACWQVRTPRCPSMRSCGWSGTS